MNGWMYFKAKKDLVSAFSFWDLFAVVDIIRFMYGSVVWKLMGLKASLKNMDKCCWDHIIKRGKKRGKAVEQEDNWSTFLAHFTTVDPRQ